MDVSMAFQEKPTTDQLRAYTERYIENNDIGVPKVSLKVSFAQLNQSEEYKHLKLLERVSLFDTVSVVFPLLNVSAKAKVVKTVYNVLLDRMESVTLGSVRANIADTIVSQNKEIASKPTKTALEQAREAATAWLTNGNGYAYFRKDDMGNIIDILFLDTPDVDTAVNVLRIGQSGIGFSNNGINGPYASAWTIDGKFNADFITSGTIYGLLIKAGIIKSADDKIVLDLSGGKEPVFNTGISTNGIIVRGDEAGAKKIFSAYSYKSTDGKYYGSVEFNSTNGKNIFNIGESVNSDGDKAGVLLSLYNQSHSHRVLLASGANAGFNLTKNDNTIVSCVDGTDGGVMSVANPERSKFVMLFSDGSQMGLWLRDGNKKAGSFLFDANGESDLATTKIKGKTISWKSNGDGTYTLIGK
jgi:hypothetical protein